MTPYNSGYFVLAAVLYVKTLYVRSDEIWDPKTDSVRLSSDSPTTIGGSTTLVAEVLNFDGPSFRFCFYYFDGSHCEPVNDRIYNFTISNWKATGKYKVTVTVEKTRPHYARVGNARTYVFVTDEVMANLQTIPSGRYLSVGPVLLSVQIHDPSHMFSSITFNWDFDDGTYLNNTQIRELSHNFTQIKTCNVKVSINATAHGIVYNGTAKKEMEFHVDFNPSLTVISASNTSTIRLPYDNTKTAYAALGQTIELIVKYNNPYSIVDNCYAQWSLRTTEKGCNLKHTFNEIGEKYVYITPTLEVDGRNISLDLFQKSLFIEEPTSGLTLERHNYTTLTKYLQANISCSGSPPFMMCWSLTMSSSPVVGDPFVESCTSLSEECRFSINYTISYKGAFKLDISVINRVGSAHVMEHISIPEPTPKHHHNKTTEAVSAVVPIVICLVIGVILIYLIRKVYKIRHRSVLETANFDFRDEDCQSVDMNMGNKWCPSFRFFKKNKDYLPLLENWDARSGSSSLYSDIL